MKEKKYKYVTNMGLAFDEERALRKLHELAKEGWFLEKFTLMGTYRLTRGEPREIIYSMDYKRLDEIDQVEYIEMFEASGWEHMYSYYDMHFFAAPPDTIPIYTEKESHLHKYRTQRIQCFRWTLMSLIFLVFLFVLAKKGLPHVSIELVKLSIYLLVGITSGIVFSLIMLTFSFFLRERRVIKQHSKKYTKY